MTEKKEWDNNMRISVFPNKKTKESQPDMTGNLEINGTEYKVSLWVKVPAKGGDKFLSGQIEEKDAWKNGGNEKTNKAVTKTINQMTSIPQTSEPPSDDDNDLPF